MSPFFAPAYPQDSMHIHPSEPLGNALPQELLQQILSELHHHRDFLKSCSLVNHAWLCASRVILFRSIDLTALLAQPDWVSAFVKLPFNVGEYARQVTVKKARWLPNASPTRALLLSHFATSVTALSLSNLVISNFADFARTASALKGLTTLSLDHVQFETSTIDLAELIPHCNTLALCQLERITVFHSDIGLVFSWLLAHSVIPKVSKISCGPCETRWKQVLIYYCNYTMANLSEIGFRFPDTTSAPYSTYYYVEGVIGFPELTSPLAHDSLGDILSRYEARYGFNPGANGVLPYPNTMRTIRVHTFFGGEGQGSVIRTIWVPRVLANVSKGFRGRIVFDVEATSVKEIIEGEVDWRLLEDILATDIFCELEAIVFLVLSNISLGGLESLISRRMPRTHARGILRFEKADEAVIRPINVL